MGWRISFALAAAGVVAATLSCAGPTHANAQETIDVAHLPAWHVPDIAAVADDEEGRAIRYGRRLFERTSARTRQTPPSAMPARGLSARTVTLMVEHSVMVCR